jgi:hypothetical protein
MRLAVDASTRQPQEKAWGLAMLAVADDPVAPRFCVGGSSNVAGLYAAATSTSLFAQGPLFRCGNFCASF